MTDNFVGKAVLAIANIDTVSGMHHVLAIANVRLETLIREENALRPICGVCGDFLNNDLDHGRTICVDR